MACAGEPDPALPIGNRILGTQAKAIAQYIVVEKPVLTERPVDVACIDVRLPVETLVRRDRCWSSRSCLCVVHRTDWKQRQVGWSVGIGPPRNLNDAHRFLPQHVAHLIELIAGIARHAADVRAVGTKQGAGAPPSPLPLLPWAS
jgi:hypothetical protein